MELADLPVELREALETLEVLVSTAGNKLNEEWEINNSEAKREFNAMLYAMDSVIKEAKNVVLKYHRFLETEWLRE